VKRHDPALWLAVIIVSVAVMFAPLPSFAQNGVGATLTVAAAADLTDALKEISAGFEKQSGTRARLVFGSSGNLAAQVRNGAPFDVFLSADMDYPKSLVDDGFADGGTLFTYAVGALAVLAPADSVNIFRSRGLDALLDAKVRRIAIANPAHAPYGRAAEQLLRQLKLYEQVAPKLVVGENVAQATQFVVSGNAQAGVVSRSQALTAARSGRFEAWEPPKTYSPIVQGAVVLKRSAQREVALRFLQYLKSKDAVDILMRYGFSAPPKPHGDAEPPPQP
jgi:molybdate transport system substrate-binding protein